MKPYSTLSLGLLIVLTLSACEKKEEIVAGPRPALIQTISAEGAASTSIITGEVKARFESAQGFRVGGKILSRQVEIGTVVRKGQLLAQLDTEDAKLNIVANQADIASAEAALALAKSNLERQRQLIDKKFISAASLDSFEAQYKAAQARVEQSKAVTSVSRNQRRYTSLVAERDGVVTDIRAEPGQVVAAGEVIVRIMDPSQLEVVIPVPENRVSQLAVGDAATVKLWANPAQSYDASIREIAPAADTVTRSYSVKVALRQIDEQVKAGMTAGVRFSQLVDHAILVPSPAVIERQQQTLVWKLDTNNVVHKTPVQVISYREDGVLLGSGLAAGDRIVIAGASVLEDKQQVRPVEEAK